MNGNKTVLLILKLWKIIIPQNGITKIRYLETGLNNDIINKNTIKNETANKIQNKLEDWVEHNK